MPDLYQTLLKYDLGHLKIIAQLWGLELTSHDLDSAAQDLCASLLDPQAAYDTIDILSADAHAALNSLAEANGKIEWNLFARRFGEIREMGTGKRDREKPYQNPISTAEILFYRGLLAKAFFDSGKGAREYAYIPDDLIPLIEHQEQNSNMEVLGRPAMPTEKSFETFADDHILDDATTLLAALRMAKTGFQADQRIMALLTTAKIIKKNSPQTEAAKNFLESPRADALNLLYKAWLDSGSFDELRLAPELVCEGEWRNSPRETRHTILNFLETLPQDKWWSLLSFLNDLKAKHPDFQRPAGDYDSWFIKRKSDGQYLRGFATWDEVDGSVVKMIIEMLHLLGKVDLARVNEDGLITSFRLSTSLSQVKESEKISISSSGRVIVPRFFRRAIRYQLARFCEGEEEKQDEYRYQISARSLKHAQEQGLKAEQLLSLLVKHTNGNVPPPLVKALKRWETHGTEARVEKMLVLRVSSSEVLKEMRKSKAGKFLGEALSPTAVIVKEGAIGKVMAALTELGILADDLNIAS